LAADLVGGRVVGGDPSTIDGDAICVSRKRERRPLPTTHRPRNGWVVQYEVGPHVAIEATERVIDGGTVSITLLVVTPTRAGRLFAASDRRETPAASRRNRSSGIWGREVRGMFYDCNDCNKLFHFLQDENKLCRFL
jgi:hypothetical protein